jgi:hypothetical protein
MPQAEASAGGPGNSLASSEDKAAAAAYPPTKAVSARVVIRAATGQAMVFLGCRSWLTRPPKAGLRLTARLYICN